jgi:hypothetical protein
MMSDGKEGAVENVKDEHYVAMPKSWEARNNMQMNKGMGYGNMADIANTAHPPTKMEGAKNNRQLDPKMPGENEFNYNANRGNK